jgi:hypothetical protein
MREIVHMAAGPVAFVFFVLAMRSWFIGVVYSFRAAANRRPGVAWSIALGSVMLGSEIYTDEGEKLANRARGGVVGFIGYCVIGALIGLVMSATSTS